MDKQQENTNLIIEFLRLNVIYNHLSGALSLEYVLWWMNNYNNNISTTQKTHSTKY